MQKERDTIEFNAFIHVLNWIGEYPHLWNQAFPCTLNDELNRQDYIALIQNMLIHKQYILLFVMLTINKYHVGLDNALEKITLKMLAENIKESDIQEIGERIVQHLKQQAAKS